MVGANEMHRITECEAEEAPPSGYAVNYHSHDVVKIWLNQEAEDSNSAEHILLHEEVHIVTDEVFKFARNLIRTFIADATTKQHLLDELEGHNEAQTNRLTRAFLRLQRMGEKKKASSGPQPEAKSGEQDDSQGVTDHAEHA